MSTKRAILFLAEGFEEVEAVTPVDFLRRAGIEVTTLGIGGREIRGAHDITVLADVPVEDFTGDFDALVLPGGMPGAANIAASHAADALIRQAAAEKRLIAAICAAPSVVLYPKGVLDGRKATCFPGYEKEWKNASFSSDRVVVDGNLITSRGAGTAAEFALAVISALGFADTAEKIREGTLQRPPGSAL